MTPENFCYWLQGHFEISSSNKLDETEVQTIKDHLKLVFNKVTPNRHLPQLWHNNSNTDGIADFFKQKDTNIELDYEYLTPGASC